MTIRDFLLATFIAFGFTGWPNVANYLQVPSAWTNAIVFWTTAVVVTIGSYGGLKVAMPDTRAQFWLVVVAAMNAVAIICYTARTSDHTTNPASFMLLVFVLMMVGTPVINFMLSGTVLSTRQMAWLALAVFSIIRFQS